MDKKTKRTLRLPAILLSFALTGCMPNATSIQNSSVETPNVQTTEVSSSNTETKKVPNPEPQEDTVAKPKTPTESKVEPSQNNEVDFESKLHKEGYDVLTKKLYQKIYSNTLDYEDLEDLKNAVISRYAEIYYPIVSSSEVSLEFYKENYNTLTFIDKLMGNEKSGVYVSPNALYLVGSENELVAFYSLNNNVTLQEFGASFINLLNNNPMPCDVGPNAQEIYLLSKEAKLVKEANLEQPHGFLPSITYGNLNVSDVEYYLYQLKSHPLDPTIRNTIQSSVCKNFKSGLYKALTDSLDGSNHSDLVPTIYQSGQAIKINPNPYDYNNPGDYEPLNLYLCPNGVLAVGDNNETAFWEMSWQSAILSPVFDAYSIMSGDGALEQDDPNFTKYARVCNEAFFSGKDGRIKLTITSPQLPYGNDGTIHYSQTAYVGPSEGNVVFPKESHTPEQAKGYSTTPIVDKAASAVLGGEKPINPYVEK